MSTKPTIGRIVIYKSKIDNGPGNDVFSPAVIIRTRDTCVPEVAKRWGPEPTTVTSASDPSVTHETASRPSDVVDMLPDDTTVDLVVHGLGKDYREYNVKMGSGLGEWSWPERVDEKKPKTGQEGLNAAQIANGDWRCTDCLEVYEKGFAPTKTDDGPVCPGCGAARSARTMHS